MDAVIRPSLRQAFPLPTKEDKGNERFQRLPDALAQVASEQEPTRAADFAWR